MSKWAAFDSSMKCEERLCATYCKVICKISFRPFDENKIQTQMIFILSTRLLDIYSIFGTIVESVSSLHRM